MARNPTPPMMHAIIPNGQQDAFRWSGLWSQVNHSVEPFQLLTGEWAIPFAVTSIEGLPEEHRNAILALNNFRQVNCCDFSNCNHE